jgi:hypothetical protein
MRFQLFKPFPLVLILIVSTLLLTAAHASNITFTTIDISPINPTNEAIDISGNIIVGTYGDTGDKHSFIYDGSKAIALPDAPGSSSGFDGFGTQAYGISGNRIVGTVGGSFLLGFMYDGSSYTTLEFPGIIPTKTFVGGIDGNNVIGHYTDASKHFHGFLYDGSNYKVIDDPTSTDTQLTGISGNKIVGFSNNRGFIYDGTSFQTLPAGPDGSFLIPTGVEGNNVVGWYENFSNETGAHGFLYDGSSILTIDDPLADPLHGIGGTVINDIEGNTIIGFYYDSHGGEHGFVAVVPEPSGVGLQLLAALILRRRPTPH